MAVRGRRFSEQALPELEQVEDPEDYYESPV